MYIVLKKFLFELLFDNSYIRFKMYIVLLNFSFEFFLLEIIVRSSNIYMTDKISIVNAYMLFKHIFTIKNYKKYEYLHN